MSSPRSSATLADGVLMAVAAAVAGVVPGIVLLSVGLVLHGGTDGAMAQGVSLAGTTLLWALIPAGIGVALAVGAMSIGVHVALWHGMVLGGALGCFGAWLMLGELDIVTAPVGIACGLAGALAASRVWQALG